MRSVGGQGAERGGWPRPTRATGRGGPGVRTWPSAPGARSGRTTATTAPPGTTSRTTTPGPGPTGGTRTAWPASATSGRRSASRWRCGTAGTRSSRSASSGWPAPEGNHGEDAKEYWWYLDSTPTHSCMRWRYHYPQAAFPYGDLVRVNGAPRPGRARVRAGRHRHLRRGPVLGGHRRLRQGRPDRHVHHGHASTNHGPGGGDPARAADAVVPQHLGLGAARLRRRAARSTGTTTGTLVGRAPHARPAGAGRRRRARGRWSATTSPTRSGCGAWRAARRTRRTASTTTSCTVSRRSTRTGSAPRRALHYALDRAGRRQPRRSGCGWPRSPTRPTSGRPSGRRSHARLDLRRRLRRGDAGRRKPRRTSSSPSVTPPGASADEAMVLRQAVAGLMWGKQFYHYDVARWLDGDPAGRRRRRAAGTAQQPLVAHVQLRRHLHAGPVGVPVVRRLGPGLPLRGDRPGRPRLRQGAAAAAAARVVHAPQRADPGVRVGLRTT